MFTRARRLLAALLLVGGALASAGGDGRCVGDGSCDAGGAAAGSEDAASVLQLHGVSMTQELQINLRQDPGTGSRIVDVRAAANVTCEMACGYVGGLPVVEESSDGEEGGTCSCDLGPLVAPAVSVSPDMLLRQAPFLMTHDSGTGYMYKLDVESPFFRTQYINILQQIRCGARAFDFRVVAGDNEFTKNRVHFHHTSGDGWGWKSHQSMEEFMPPIIDWARAHPEELVIMSVSHCAVADGALVQLLPPRGWKRSECQNFVEAFEATGARVQTDCGTLNSWTLQQASEFAEMEGGGRVLFILGEGYCVTDNWVPAVTRRPDLLPYVKGTMAKVAGETRMFQVQSFLQQQSLFVPLQAKVNKDVFDWVTTTNLYNGVNLLEVNMACAYGTSIATALGTAVTEEDADQCIRDCVYACIVNWACRH